MKISKFNIQTNDNAWLIFIFIVSLLTACGGGGSSSDSNDEPVTDTGDTSPVTDVTNPVSGVYDLKSYMFDASLDNVGGFVTYESHMHNQQTGDEVLVGVENSEQWETTATDTIVFSVNNTGEPEHTYIVKDVVIEDTENDTGLVANHDRFVNVSDVYLDHDVPNPLFDSSNRSCEVLEHLDTLDLSIATSSIADGVYQDLLHVRCVLSGTLNGDTLPLGDVDIYYAKDTGHVFSKDNIGLLAGGPAYMIPVRSATTYYGADAFVPDETQPENPADPVPDTATSIPMTDVYGYKITAGDGVTTSFNQKYVKFEVNCDGTGKKTTVWSDDSSVVDDFDQTYSAGNELAFKQFNPDGSSSTNYIYADSNFNITTGVSRLDFETTGLLVTEIAKLQECNTGT